MGVLEDITKIPLQIAEDFFNKGWLTYIIIGLIVVLIYFIGKYNGWF